MLNLLSSQVATGTVDVYTVLVGLGVLTLFGLYGGRIFERLGVPRITGYLVAGIVIGPSAIGLVHSDVISSLDVITNVALGFIAFGIGMEILWSTLKYTGVKVVIITLMQSLFAALAVILILLLVGAPLWLALIIGAIATATAPAPILMLTKQYRTKGPVTDTLLPLVGIDDALGIIIFGIFLSIAVGLHNGVDAGLGEMLVAPLMEILLSIVVGLGIGLLLTILIKADKRESRDYVLVLALLGVLFSVGIAANGMFGYHLSVILTPMVTGIVYGNTIDREKLHRTVRYVDSFNPIFIIALFAIAGAQLDLSIFRDISTGGQILIWGGLYVIVRIIGKVAGSYLGGILAKADPNVKKWLGIALIPQGGVEIGLANVANSAIGGTDGNAILTIVLLATFAYGLIGPSGVKLALEKSGEMTVTE